MSQVYIFSIAVYKHEKVTTSHDKHIPRQDFGGRGSHGEPIPKLSCWAVDELEAARSQSLEDLVWIIALSDLPQFRQSCSVRELLEDVLGLSGCCVVQVNKIIVKAHLLRPVVELIDHVLEELVDCLIILGIGPVTAVQNS